MQVLITFAIQLADLTRICSHRPLTATQEQGIALADAAILNIQWNAGD